MRIEIKPPTEAKSAGKASLTANSANAPPSLGWNNILAPTDLSEPSKCALKTAAVLAQKCRAKLVLFHVVQCPNCSSFYAPPDAEKMMEQARQSLDDIAQVVPSDVSVEKIVRFGTSEPVDQIIDEANHASADLIVIATHGYSGFKRALLGSTAERVVRHAPCPVLIVRRSGDNSPPTPLRVESENPFKAD